MIDAVLSYHLNPHTCGVAKFNQALARTLGVRLLPLGATLCEHPLVSIKPDEISGGVRLPVGPFDLFLHGVSTAAWYDALVRHARRVYAANEVIAADVRRARPDVVTAWCPSTVDGNPTRGALNVLTFGMAHKLQVPCYYKLKALLDGTGEDYTVSVSTAIHEGSPWDTVATAGEQLRIIFGSHTRVLGYLSDDALAKELQDCSAVALFFDPAVRANNTTFWAAVDAGKLIVTTLDAHSPKPTGRSSVWDIHALEAWPSWLDRARGERWGGGSSHHWGALAQLVQPWQR